MREAVNLNWIKATFAPLRAPPGALHFIDRDQAEQIVECVVRRWGSWSWAGAYKRDRRLEAQIKRTREWAERQWGPRLSDDIESSILHICTSMVDWWYHPNGDEYRRKLYRAWEELT